MLCSALFFCFLYHEILCGVYLCFTTFCAFDTCVSVSVFQQQEWREGLTHIHLTHSNSHSNFDSFPPCSPHSDATSDHPGPVPSQKHTHVYPHNGPLLHKLWETITLHSKGVFYPLQCCGSHQKRFRFLAP